MTSLLLVATGSLVVASAALAQQPGQSGEATERTASTVLTARERAAADRTGGIPLGPVTAYPSVNLSLEQNDNLYLTPDNKTSALIWTLTPGLRLATNRAAGAFNYGLTLGGGLGKFSNSPSGSADNFTDLNLGGYADFALGTRLRTGLTANAISGHDPRGSTNDPFTPTPNHYRQLSTAAKVSYGAPGAQGRLEFDLGNIKRTYTNNRESTAVNDRNTDDYGVTFFWRVAPKTEVLIQGRHSKIDYSLAPGSPTPAGTPYVSADSTDNRLLIGVKWEATAKTTGIFRFGRGKKDFADPSRSGGSNTTWEGTIRWSPLTYSIVDVSLVRGANETTGGYGDYILNTTSGVKWSHQWSSRTSTDVRASYMTESYQGLSIPRNDNTQTYGANLNYRMRRWLTAGGGYTHTIRDSGQNQFEYKRNVFMLFLTGTL